MSVTPPNALDPVSREAVADDVGARAPGRRARRVVVFAITVAGVGTILALGLLRTSDRGAAPAPSTPRPAPALEGEWLVGPPARLAALRGTPVVINFWASWCAPCRREAPDLARFDRAFRGRARLVGVDFSDTRGDARAFVREFGWTFPVVRDPKERLARRYRLAGLPTTFIVDRRGRITRVLQGPQTFDELARAVNEVRG